MLYANLEDDEQIINCGPPYFCYVIPVNLMESHGCKESMFVKDKADTPKWVYPQWGMIQELYTTRDSAL